MRGCLSAGISVTCLYPRSRRASREHAYLLNAALCEDVYQTMIKTRQDESSSTWHITRGTPPQKVFSANGANTYFTRHGSLPYGGLKTNTISQLASNQWAWPTAAPRILGTSSHTPRLTVSMGPRSPPIWSRDWGTVHFFYPWERERRREIERERYWRYRERGRDRYIYIYI